MSTGKYERTIECKKLLKQRILMVVHKDVNIQ